MMQDNTKFKLTVDHYLEDWDKGIINLFCCTDGMTREQEPNHIEKTVQIAAVQAFFESQSYVDDEGEPVEFYGWWCFMGLYLSNKS